jgi:hypothetical protein
MAATPRWIPGAIAPPILFVFPHSANNLAGRTAKIAQRQLGQFSYRRLL